MRGLLSRDLAGRGDARTCPTWHANRRGEHATESLRNLPDGGRRALIGLLLLGAVFGVLLAADVVRPMHWNKL